MKPRTLASIGAVLLYLWCELFQASPFVFTEQGRGMATQSSVVATATESEDGPKEGSKALFGPARLAKQDDKQNPVSH